MELLWKQFFSDPSQWWDHTTDKVDLKYPDFKHKKTGVALWINDSSNPVWVKGLLLSMLPGSVPRSLFSWNTMLARHVKSEQVQEALELFREMQAAGVKPDSYTFVQVLNSCATGGALEKGKCVHAHANNSGFESDLFVGNALIDMYAKCGSIHDAWRVFECMTNPDVVSWNSMLTGCVKCEQCRKALELFQCMQEEGVKPNRVTFVVVMTACTSLAVLDEGKIIHAQIIESGFRSDVFVGSTLVNMYAKCGDMYDAWTIFHTLPHRNAVSWNAMLAGFVRCNEWQKALDLFQQMEVGGVKPTIVTFVIVLNACAGLAALEEGRRIHAQVIRTGCEFEVVVGSTLIHMYAKCGSIDDARRVFHNMPTRDMVSWTAMLGALAMHGCGTEAISLFEAMCLEGVEFDVITFTCLLTACSHAGLVDDGVHYFESMSGMYGISPTVDHYVSMVDLLSRAGHLDQAEDLLRREPKLTWHRIALMTMLGACRHYGNVEMGKRITRLVVELDQNNVGCYQAPTVQLESESEESRKPTHEKFC